MIKIDALGLHLDNPLKVYHASLNATAILKDQRFKTRKELKSNKVGAGGGPDDLVSFTGDARVAEAICVGLGTFIRIGVGDLQFEELLDEFKRACPNAYSSFMSRFKSSIFVSPSINDISSLYKEMLSEAAWTREAFDPVFFGTEARFFSDGDLTQLENVGYLSVNLKPNVVIYPNTSSDFDSLSPYKRVFEFSKNYYSVRDGWYPPTQMEYIKHELRHLFEISKDFQVKDRHLKAEDSVFAQYLYGLNEYRATQDALDIESLFLQKYLFDIYLDDLPRLWKTSDIKSFYPNFEYKQIADNLSSYRRPQQPYNADL